MSLTSTSSLLASLAALYALYKIVCILYNDFTSPISNLPGLSSANIIFGNVRDMLFTDHAAVQSENVTKHGTTFKFRAMLWENWLFTADVKLISHILKNDTTIWHKPDNFLARELFNLLGPGIILVDSDIHRKQRKILNPAFAPAEIKGLTKIFFDKALKLRDIWINQIQQSDREVGRIEVLSWLSRTTLEVIGEAGFGYKFDALTEDPNKSNELHDAFKTMFNVGKSPGILRFARRALPPLQYIIPAEQDQERYRSRETMLRIGRQLLKDRQLAIDPMVDGKKGKIEGNDILSLLVRVNASGEQHQRLPEEQILAQIPTFIVAGHETTSTATAWALYSLSQDTFVQDNLRKELLSVTSETPNVDELNALPYLDAVTREVLRFHSPIPATARIATQDDVLPLQNPVTDKNGKVHLELRVKKGQIVLISLAMVNRLESIWGNDADKFNPERWSSLPEAANTIPGVWGNQLSFFGGPRSCIGFRFSLIEMKAILFTLIRAFEFELAVPGSDIIKRTEIISRPSLRTEPDGLNQLPMIVRPVTR